MGSAQDLLDVLLEMQEAGRPLEMYAVVMENASAFSAWSGDVEIEIEPMRDSGRLYLLR